ncbi:heme/hemin ABC transporter substrate-binding protein [Thiobaca trueperi]|uniref:Iron complex transport system substrate-binding protein n=1 Tax=Thiobaca trueperi TaxID=127458 RepID=A0A4R3MSP2_9GAMM|nr:ABC transporter substrate-binding protein [Thiobaca trueperi]TCT18101.1 iron complex transport system substrate-binding protein [Thiobaca trueperi]
MRPEPLAALVLTLSLATGAALAAERLVSVDGAITEIVYALDQGARLVGVDTTSTYPPETKSLASVGYKRALSAEGLLSLSPDLVLATDDAGPPEVLDQIRSAGVEVRQVPDAATLDGLREKIGAVAAALDAGDRGETLNARIDLELKQLEQRLGQIESRPRVLFLMVVGSGIDHSAGRGAPVDTLIWLAGGENVLHETVVDYKPLSPEAALAAAPDVILVSDRALKDLNGIDGVLGRAGLAATPAGQERRVIALDNTLLFNFGPRLAQAAEELARQLGTFRDPEVAKAGD